MSAPDDFTLPPMPADSGAFAADCQTALQQLGVMEGSANRDLDTARRDGLQQASQYLNRQLARIHARAKEIRKAMLQRIVETASAEEAMYREQAEAAMPAWHEAKADLEAAKARMRAAEDAFRGPQGRAGSAEYRASTARAELSEMEPKRTTQVGSRGEGTPTTLADELGRIGAKREFDAKGPI